MKSSRKRNRFLRKVLVAEVLEPRWSPSDVSQYFLIKTQEVSQVSAGLFLEGYNFTAQVDPTTVSSVTGATLYDPYGNQYTLSHTGSNGNLAFTQHYSSSAALEAVFPAGYGAYLYITGATDGLYEPELLLPFGYPANAPDVTDFSALQNANPDNQILVTWASLNGTSSDFVQLRIKDGSGNTVFTSANYGQSGALNGISTSFWIPANTLSAATNYTADLLFEQFQYKDTISYPDATGLVASANDTTFNITTQTNPVTADVSAYWIAKTQEFDQNGVGTPTLESETGYGFYSEVDPTTSSSVTADPTLQLHGGTTETLALDGSSYCFSDDTYASAAALNAVYAKGNYTFTIDTLDNGNKVVSLTMPKDTYPTNTPQISNWAAAQSINAGASFTMTWDSLGGATSDFVQLQIEDSSGNTVLESPDFGSNGALNGTSTSYQISAGTLDPGETYSATLLFMHVTTLDGTSYPGAIGVVAFGKDTHFQIATIPPQGALQFSAASYVESVNSDSATITVTRIAGSTGAVTVDYATTTSTCPDDYTITSGTLYFADGQTTATFQVPIIPGDQIVASRNQTVGLVLSNPTGEAILGVQSNATLVIRAAGTRQFTDSDGDTYSISLSGPGVATIFQNDPGDTGSGPISTIELTGTTVASSLSVTVKKASGGDGIVTIGSITDADSLKSITASSSDLIGSGIAIDGTVGVIQMRDVLDGTSIQVGTDASVSSPKLSLTLGNVGDGSEITSTTPITTLQASTIISQSQISAPSIATLSVTAGSLLADLNVAGSVNSIKVTGGAASGDWSAASFGTISITGGSFTGSLTATATPVVGSKTPLISSLSISGGNLDAPISTLGDLGKVSVKKDKLGNYGNVLSDTTINAQNITSISVDGSFSADITATGKLGSLQVKNGAASGTWSAATVAKISVTGGNFNGSLTVANSPFYMPGALGTVTLKKNSLGIGGNIITGSTIVAGNISGISVAGSMSCDIAAGNIKSLKVSNGSASGTWSAASFGSISITGGGFSGSLTATGPLLYGSLTATAGSSNTASISSISITGGDLTGNINTVGNLGTLTLKKDKLGNGGNVTGSTIAAMAISQINIAGNLDNSYILAGANLGGDRVIGGDNDTFGAGSIGKFSVSGQVNSSVVGAGLDLGADDAPRGGDDSIIGATASAIKSFLIGGTASADSYFAAGYFPSVVKIGGSSVNPTTDSRFFMG